MNKLEASIFFVTLALSFIGIFILYETSTYSALFNLDDKYYYVKNQVIWLALGIIISIIMSRFYYKMWYYLSLPLLIVSIVLLCLVFIPGVGIELKGVHRWINLGIIVVQPSEFLKITLVTYLAAWLSNKEKGRLAAFLILLLTCVFLVVIEPDLGTSFIIGITSIVIYFLSGSKIKDMVFISALSFVGFFFLISIAPYRLERLASFKNFDPADFSTAQYHIKQILVALGSGGVSGIGFGNSIQKYLYIPESTTDSIFAIFAEEAGFIGSLFLLVIYIVQLFLGFLTAARAPDLFGKLLASGIITFIGLQTLINLGSQVALVPLTGIPLPFISYGGSSLIINFASIGILLNISRAR